MENANIMIDGSNAVEVETTFEKEVWLDTLAVLYTKIESMEKLAEDKANKVDKRELYELQQTYKMIHTMVMHDQHEVNFSEPVKVERLMRVYRYIENYILDIKGIDRIINGGMFTVLPIWILPADKVDKARKNRWGAMLAPTEFGLPDFEEVRYDTIKPLGSNCYYALARGSKLDEHILGARHLDYVMMG